MDAAQQDQLSPQDLAALQEVHLHLQVAKDPRADKVGKYLTSIGAPPQTFKPDQPGMQPAVNPLEARPAGEKAEETIAAGVHSAHDTILGAVESFNKMLHPSQWEGGANHIQKDGVIKGTGEVLKDSFSKMNPIAPDTGQGPMNRTAQSFGTVAGGAILGEAMPGAEDVQGLKEAPGRLRAASKAAVDKVASAADAAAKSPITQAAVETAPDLIGAISPRLLHTVRASASGAKLIGRIRSAINPPSPEAPAPAPAPPDTSVPASSVSMTQFPLPMAKASMDALNKAADAADSGAKMSVPTSTAQVPAPLAAKVNTVLDNAQAQVKKVIADTEAAYPKKGTFADMLDDKAFSQEANWDLEKHWYRALSEERQKFFADNAPTFTKGQLVAREQVGQILNEASQKAAKILDEAKLPSETRKKLISSISAPAEPTPPVKPAPAAPSVVKPIPAEYQDMTEILRRSKEAVERARKGK